MGGRGALCAEGTPTIGENGYSAQTGYPPWEGGSTLRRRDTHHGREESSLRRGFPLPKEKRGLFAPHYFPNSTHLRDTTVHIQPVTHTQGGIYREKGRLPTYKGRHTRVYREAYTRVIPLRTLRWSYTLVYTSQDPKVVYIPGYNPICLPGCMYGDTSLYASLCEYVGCTYPLCAHHPFHCWSSMRRIEASQSLRTSQKG